MSSKSTTTVTNSTIVAGGAAEVHAIDSAQLIATLVLENATTADANPLNGVAQAKGFGFAVAVNDVRGGASALVTDSSITAGSILVDAMQTSALTAVTEVSAETNVSGGFMPGGSGSGGSGGNLGGSGTGSQTTGSGGFSSTAVTGIVANNVVQGAVAALVTNSMLTTTGAAGDISVGAKTNGSLIATVINAVSGGQRGVGITVSFNSVGWRPQNLLFNAIDALIGSPEISQAFDGTNASGSLARVVDSTPRAM